MRFRSDPPTTLRGSIAPVVTPFGVFSLNGERCTAGSRILAERALYDRLVDELGARAANIRVGDPSDPATEIGALVHPDHHTRVLSYVQAGLDEGARLVAGGARPAGLATCGTCGPRSAASRPAASAARAGRTAWTFTLNPVSSTSRWGIPTSPGSEPEHGTDPPRHRPGRLRRTGRHRPGEGPLVLGLPARFRGHRGDRRRAVPARVRRAHTPQPDPARGPRTGRVAAGLPGAGPRRP